MPSSSKHPNLGILWLCSHLHPVLLSLLYLCSLADVASGHRHRFDWSIEVTQYGVADTRCHLQLIRLKFGASVHQSILEAIFPDGPPPELTQPPLPDLATPPVAPPMQAADITYPGGPLGAFGSSQSSRASTPPPPPPARRTELDVPPQLKFRCGNRQVEKLPSTQRQY